MRELLQKVISRRGMLWGGLAAAGGAAVTARSALGQTDHSAHAGHIASTAGGHSHGGMTTVGDVDPARNGFDPTAMLTDWDGGTVSRLPDGRTLRTYEIEAEDKEIEIAPGLL